jgi:hypothetical protein
MQQQNATQLLQRLLKVKPYSTGTPGHSFTSTVPLNIHSQVLMFSGPLLRREPECSCLSKLHIHSSYAQGISAHISPACSDFSRVCLASSYYVLHPVADVLVCSHRQVKDAPVLDPNLLALRCSRHPLDCKGGWIGQGACKKMCGEEGDRQTLGRLCAYAAR